MADEHDEDPQKNETRDRLLLPLLLPIIIFLFAVLVIYGLSRIYLDLSHVEFGDQVNAATPLAIGVALGILLVCWYLASNPRLPGWAIAGIVVLAGLLLTGGSILAAVVDEPESESQASQEPTPTGGQAGGVTVKLDEFSVSPVPETTGAGQVTFTASNVGSITHNLTIIRTDEAPDSLPVVDGQVDEAALDVVASSDNVDPETSEEVQTTLEEGNYVLICNVPDHYAGGMRAGFTVGPPAPDGGGQPPGEGVTADLHEFSVSADPATVPAGPTTITASNSGAISHNLRAIRTDDAPDSLPVTSDDMVDEDAVDVVAETDQIDPGDDATIEVELEEGNYVLICNVATHYEAGMRTAFVVGPAPGGGGTAPP